MCWIQGAKTRTPHRPQTTDGTTASRSTTYTIGRDHRYGTTSVSSRAMPTLTGTAMTSRDHRRDGGAVDEGQRAELVGRGVPVVREDLQALGGEPRRGLLAGRDGDQDQDHQHQQAGGEGEDLETAVAERPLLRQGAGGSGRAGRIRLYCCAHDAVPIWSTSRSCSAAPGPSGRCRTAVARIRAQAAAAGRRRPGSRYRPGASSTCSRPTGSGRPTPMTER